MTKAKDILFMGVFGDDYKQVQVSAPSGHTGGYQVYIDQWYQGLIVNSSGEWTGQLNRRSDLQSDDIQILGAMIEGRVDLYSTPHPE